MNKNLSPKKIKFVNFIDDFIRENGYSPTFKEIMTGLNINSLGTINWYINELENDKILKRTKGYNGKRSLSLINNEKKSLPLLGTISAGNPLEPIEDNEYIEVPPAYLHRDNFVLRVKGDSMIDENIQDGDFIIIRQTTEVESGKIIVAIVNNEATLKYYYPKSKHIELHPRNKKYDIIKVYPEDDFQISGKLLFVFRKFED